jgi:hypothetical protein
MRRGGALELAASMRFQDYRPGLVVKAVNELQPLGKDSALTRIERQARGGRATGLFWVLRVLFDPPAAQPCPPVKLGRPTTPPPKDPAALPRFPIVVACDAPFLVIRDYALGGKAEPVQAHIAWFRKHGQLRGAQLQPPLDGDGVRDEFAAVWRAAYGEAHLDAALSLVERQLISFSP